MSSVELLMVGSVIVLGAILGHYMLLFIYRRFRRNSPKAVALHRLQALYAYDDTPSLSTSVSSSEKSSLKRRKRHTTGPRGIITVLPNYHSQSSKTSWSSTQRERAMHELILTVHEENNRSTYLGAQTFDKSSPTAQLFGWERLPGQPTVNLGDIAHLVKLGHEAYMRVVVHPEDAKTIMDAAWAQGTESSSRRSAEVRHNDGVTLLLKAPRNSSELDRTTRVVLDAAIWYVAGLDREQNV